MLRAGIVGLPNVGKSTLFNALTRTRKAESANYPFCTIEPNVGIVTVPDERLQPIATTAGTPTLVPAAIELVDIAGLVKGGGSCAALCGGGAERSTTDATARSSVGTKRSALATTESWSPSTRKA